MKRQKNIYLAARSLCHRHFFWRSRQKGAKDLPEYQHHIPALNPLRGLRAGARLAKVTKLSALLTGRSPDRIDAKNLTEAKVMSMVLKEE